MSRIKFLNMQDMLDIYQYMLTELGGNSGIRSMHLLESAIAQPHMSAFGNYLHHNIFEMAAAYAFHIIKNHPFVDGNKRMGIIATITFLRMNNIKLSKDSDSLYELAIAIADSRMQKKDIALFLRTSQKK